jgi:hypothetical protein
MIGRTKKAYLPDLLFLLHPPTGTMGSNMPNETKHGKAEAAKPCYMKAHKRSREGVVISDFKKELRRRSGGWSKAPEH